MFKAIQAVAAAMAVIAAGGCAATDGWKGTEAEKAYEKEMAAKPEAAKLNNEHYFEIHQEGRIFVLTDPKGYEIFRATGEIPLAVTRIGAGPNRETVKLELRKAEAKAMEKTVGYKGIAQKMYEGELKGAEQGFYGEIRREGRIYVFGDWKDLEAFKASGEAAYGLTLIGKGPQRETVVFVQNSKSSQQAPAETIARFESMYAAQ